MLVSGDSSKFFDPLLLLIFMRSRDIHSKYAVFLILCLKWSMERHGRRMEACSVRGRFRGLQHGDYTAKQGCHRLGHVRLLVALVPQHFRRRFHPAVCPVLREVRMFLLDL